MAEELAKFKEHLRQLPRNRRRKAVREYAELLQISEATLYRKLKLGRKHSSHKAKIDRASVEAVSAIKMTSMSKKGTCLPTQDALEMAQLMGLARGDISRASADRLMNKLKISKKDARAPKPCIRMRARGPNHVHQFDVTASLQYYLKNNGMIGYQEYDYKNKPITKTRMALLTLVDDFSRVKHQKYVFMQGENVHECVRFLWETWFGQDSNKFPFCGVPKVLYLDQGPLGKTKIFKEGMQRLGVEVIAHKPDHPRSTGKVERQQGVTQTQFGCRTKLVPAKTLNEINGWLWEYLLKFNSQQHPEFRELNRLQAWTSITDQELRRPPPWEEFVNVFFRPEQRLVHRDCRIHFENRIYAVTPELVGQWVTVWKNPYDLEKLYFEDEEHNIYGPLDAMSLEDGVVPFGEYRALKKTEREKSVEKVLELGGSLPFTADVVYGHQADGWRDIRYVGKKGEEVKAEPPFAVRHAQFASRVQAKLEIAKTLGVSIPELPQNIRAEIESVLDATLVRQEILSNISRWRRASHFDHLANETEEAGR